jgi:hypothetical protein
MALHTFENGEFPDAPDFNYNYLAAYQMAGDNLVRQLIDRSVDFTENEFGEAYTSSGGRKSSVDTAQEITTLKFDTNKYKVPSNEDYPINENIFVIIEATSISLSPFQVNNCKIYKFAEGKWVVWCTTGTDAVKRAQIYKTLFYGTDGSNSAIRTTNVTGITALKTSVTRDVGKIGYYFTRTNSSNGTYEGQFSSTSDNESVSTWSRLSFSLNGSGTKTITYRLPADTVQNNLTTTNISGTETSDEFGTDTELDEKNNPAVFQYVVNVTNVTAVSIRAIILTAKTLTSVADFTVIDFTTTHNVPAMTLAEQADIAIDYKITHNIPSTAFPGETTSLFIKPFVNPTDWEDGADIRAKVYDSVGDSGWVSIGKDGAIVDGLTLEDIDQIDLELVPKDTDPTVGKPAIRGFSVKR